MTTDINHPNIRAGVLRETVELFKHGSEDGFDPSNQADCQWLSDTYIYLLSLCVMGDGPGHDQAVLQVQFPGATEVSQPQQNPEPFPQQQFQQPQQVPYNPVPQPPAGMPQGQPPVQLPPVQPMPYNAPPQAVPQGQLHAGSSKDDIWASICQGLQSGTIGNDWYDNRISKKSQNSPDFRHKSIDAPPNQRGQVYKLSGYIKDAPPWALQVLQQYPPRS